MKVNTFLRTRVAVASLLVGGFLSSSFQVAAQTSEEKAQGLWEYTGLTTSGGKELPLTGVFLLHDGEFIQQAVFNGEPYSQQGSMAHSGTFTGTEIGIDLQAGQTLSLNPAGDTALEDMGPTTHNLTMTRDGQKLTLVFGSGTEQRFDMISAADEADIYSFKDGMLAFVDGYFVLAKGSSDSAVTGYGTYEKNGEALKLNVIRWSEAANGLAQNLKDTTLSASFDGSTLLLADGRKFVVVP